MGKLKKKPRKEEEFKKMNMKKKKDASIGL